MSARPRSRSRSLTWSTAAGWAPKWRRKLGRRGYKSVREEAAGGYVTGVYKGHGKCVIVNLDKDKRVTSVDEGSGC